MNHNVMEKVKISGIDWMISYIGWRSRNCPSQNNFSVILNVADFFCFEKLCQKITSLKETKIFLSGTIKRVLPVWEPHWYYKKGEGAGIICNKNTSDMDIEISNELPQGCALKIVYFEKSKQIVFTFCHSVFDGTGAEKFIYQLFQDNICDRIPLQKIPIDISAMKKSGQELQKVMKHFPEKDILRIPNGCCKTKNVFNTIQITPEEYIRLHKNIEDKYGPFSVSIFIFALILCNLEKHIFSKISDKKYIFVPMSVDLRNLQQETEDEFFNHWSLMPLLITRSIIQEGIDATVLHLKKLYSDALGSRMPQLFFKAADAMKYIPYRIIDILVRLQPGKTLGTFMFSFLNSDHCFNNEITNLAHFPQMPSGNNLGVFVNLYNNNLNIIISRHPWGDDENFNNFLDNVKINLHKELV